MLTLKNYFLASVPTTLVAALLAFGGATIGSTSRAMANPDPLPASGGNLDSIAPMNQVTSVSQLSDVQPTDWAFQALQSLVERYGCIVGYPDSTFRGNRALTRYEFAAGLNACLDRINELIAASTSDLATKEDLAVLQRLQEEFAAELATLRGRVDSLEARTAQLEATQFSTTTKLNGEVIFGLSSLFGNEKPDGSHLDDNPVLGDRVRLAFNTSFSGSDLLITRLDAANIADFTDAAGTPMSRLNFDDDNGNDVELGLLMYQFPLGSKTQVSVGTAGIAYDDVAPSVLNGVSGDESGSISRFGDFNPFVYSVSEGSAASISTWFSDSFNLTAAYLVDGASDPSQKNGLFNGDYSAVAQLLFKPTETLELSFAFAHSYYPGGELANGDAATAGFTGSFNANDPFDGSATSLNSYNGMLSWQVTPKFVLSGWVGFANAQQESDGDANADLWNWAVTLGFPDLGKDGNLGGIVVGMPPKVTHNEIDDREDDATALHIEAFYRMQINDHISITPGVFVITNPDHSDSDAIWVGSVRTTFTF